jgi:hypothetical protein
MRTRFSIAAALLGALLVIGCGQPAAPTKPAPEKKTDDDDHEHGEGPHGGTIVDIAGVHAEFTVDHPTKTATVYILDGKRAKKAEPIAATKVVLSIKSPAFQVDAKASPDAGDPAGKASRFVAVHEHFGKTQEFEGTLSLDLDGKPYTEDFKEKAHDHDHGKK